MSRFLSTSVMGLMLAGGLLMTPGTSQAQGPVGVQVRLGNVGFSYHQGYAYRPAYSSYGYGPVTTYAAPVTTIAPGGCLPAPVIRSYPTYYPYSSQSYYPRYGHHYHDHHYPHRW